jgi:peptide deformylase
MNSGINFSFGRSGGKMREDREGVLSVPKVRNVTERYVNEKMYSIFGRV